MTHMAPRGAGSNATIAAWLADGPRALPDAVRYQISAQVADTPQRTAARWAGRPAWTTLLAAAAMLALAITATYGVARYIGDMPRPTNVLEGPVQSATLVREERELTFTYRLPADVDFVVDRSLNGTATENYSPSGVIGFTVGGPGMYGWRETGTSSTFVEGARGIVVADVTDAQSQHEQPNVRLGDDPETFFARLDSTQNFAVADIQAAELGGVPALSARVVADPKRYSHLDLPSVSGGYGRSSVDFRHPSRALVAQIGDALVLVQIWAGTEDDLEEWLPTAMSFVGSLRFSTAP